MKFINSHELKYGSMEIYNHTKEDPKPKDPTIVIAICLVIAVVAWITAVINN